jgi:hypothetical protein
MHGPAKRRPDQKWYFYGALSFQVLFTRVSFIGTDGYRMHPLMIMRLRFLL